VDWNVLRDDMEQILGHKSFDKLVIRGGQGAIPQVFPSVKILYLSQTFFNQGYRIYYDADHLVELSLVSLSLSERFIISLGWHISNGTAAIEKLDLTDSRIMGQGFNILAASLQSNSSLKKLCLSECNLMDLALASIIEPVRSHPAITHLDISFNKGRSLTVEQISQLIVESSTLVSLNMGFLAFGEGRQVDLTPIYQSLNGENGTPSLRILQLGGNNIRDASTNGIVTMLVGNETLEQLDLSENLLSNSFIARLSENLGRMNGLRVLNLEDNIFDQNGVRMLAEVIPSNRFIQAIQVEESLASSIDGLAMGFHLDLNWGGQRILLQPQDFVPASLWPKVLERANQGVPKHEAFQRKPIAADIIYFFLRMGRLCS
jgi:Ran GTPase-activating protein (RanGAP) involved in mRNA processing and transport